MHKFMSSAAAVAALVLVAGAASSASATTFVGNYSVTANTSDNAGLPIQIQAHNNNQLNFSLNAGQSTSSMELFSISTTDTNWDQNNSNQKPISVQFHFSLPTAFGGDVEGDTFEGIISGGHLTWDNGGIETFNFGNGGKLKVDLADVNFDLADLGKHNSIDPDWTAVDAKFTLVSDSKPVVGGGGVGGVPEPASWALMIGGFGMAGGMLRRRRTTAAFAA
jgi:hypothetical protein